ncbi:TMEM175 family protein [Angustibacter aerolatus]
MRTDRGLDRFVTFLDAVVAIALTLLVLPLVDVAAEAREADSLLDVLSDHLPELGSFLLSFAVISRMWLAHHRLFEWVGRYDRSFLAANLVWVFVIVVLPFPTALIPTLDADRSGLAAFYIGSILLALVAESWTAVHLVRTPDLQRVVPDPTAEPDVPLTALRDGTVISTAWVAVGLVLVLLVPAASYRPLLLLLLSGPTERLLTVLRRRRARAA